MHTIEVLLVKVVKVDCGLLEDADITFSFVFLSLNQLVVEVHYLVLHLQQLLLYRVFVQVNTLFRSGVLAVLLVQHYTRSLYALVVFCVR